MRRTIILFIFLFVAAPVPHSGNAEAQGLTNPTAFLLCRALKADDMRLSCYDNVPATERPSAAALPNVVYGTTAPTFADPDKEDKRRYGEPFSR
jgi:hypothetical protein